MKKIRKISGILMILFSFIVLINIEACHGSLVGLGDVVDINPPDIKILAPPVEPIDYQRGDFSISGTVTDDIEVKSVSVSWPGSSVEAIIDGNNWIASVSFDSITQNGQVLFTAIASDTSGKKTAPSYRTICIDNNAPTVLVKAPQSYNPGPANSNYIILEGEVWDSSPIDYIHVEIFDSENQSVPIISGVAEGDRTWFSRISLDNSEGLENSKSYFYRIEAKDVAGNVSSYLYHASDFWSLLSEGELFPAMRDIGLWDQYGEELLDINSEVQNNMKLNILDFVYNSDFDKPRISLTNLDAEKPVSENAIGQYVPIMASAVDDKEGILESSVFLNIKKDGIDINIPGSGFNSPGNGMFTSFQFDLTEDNLLEPGQYSGSISVFDKKGISSILNFMFLVDKGAPSIFSIYPSSPFISVDSYGNIIIEAVITDDNPGVSISASATDSNGILIPGVTTSILEDERTDTEYDQIVYTSKQQITVPCPVSDNISINILVTDASGLKCSRSLDYTLDSSKPVITMSVPTMGDIISGSAITAAGDSDDIGSDVFNIELYLMQGDIEILEIPVDATWLVAAGNQIWSLPLDLTAYSEGSLTLFAKATDTAENESIIERTHFYYDLDEPELSINSGVEKEYKTVDYTLSGSIQDSNQIDQLTILVAKDGGDFSILPGFPISYLNNSDNWIYTKSVDTHGSDDGVCEYKISVVDIVGKSSTINKTIVVDTTPPELIVSNLADGNSLDSTEYTITGFVSDTSGISSVEYLMRNETDWKSISVMQTGKWELSLSGIQEGDGNSIFFRSTDLVGWITELPVINFGLDLNPPFLQIDNMLDYDGKYINDNYTLRGTVGDINGIKSLEISINSGLTYSKITDVSGTDSTDLAWSIPVVVPDDGSEDGNHLIRIKAVDNYNKETINSLSVKYDTSAPTFEITNIDDGQLISSLSYLVIGSWSDNGGSGTQEGLSKAEFKIGFGDWVDIPEISVSASVFAHNLPLVETEDETINFRVTDALGNRSDVTSFFGIKVDTAAPEITETFIGSEDSYIIHENIVLTGVVSDSHGIDILEVSINNGESQNVVFNSDGSWSFNYTNDVEGESELKFTATDVTGRVSSLIRNIIVDTTLPVVSVSNIDGSTLVNSSKYTVLGNSTDSGSGIVLVEYSLDNNNWTDAAGTGAWTVPLTSLEDGLGQTFAVRSIDRAGNISLVTEADFDVDLASPELTETSSGIMNSSTVYRNDDVILGGEASDGNILSSVIVSYKKDGDDTIPLVDDTNDDGIWSATLDTDLGEGAYEVFISATDEVGKTTVLTRNIIIDTLSPDLTISSPMDGEFIEDDSYVIRGQVTDNGGKGIEWLRYSLDGSDWNDIPLTGLNWSVSGVDFSGGGEGDKTLHVRSSDGLNITTWKTVGFKYDTADPSLVENSFGDENLVVSNIGVEFTGTASDTNFLSSLELSVNGSDVEEISVSGDGSWSYTRTADIDGLFELVFTATDIAGRTTSLRREVLIDTTSPEIFTVNPLGGNYFTSELGISGNGSDIGSGIGSIQYNIDGTDWENATGTSSWYRNVDISLLDEGSHTLNVRITDRAGNAAPEKSSHFVIDRTNPILSVSSSFDEPVYKSSGFVIDGNFSDNLNLSTGSVSVSLTDDGSPVDLSEYSVKITIVNNTTRGWSQSIPYFSDGEYIITVTATDSVGRTSSETRTVDVDTTLPVVSVSNIDGSTLVNSSKYTVLGNCTDSGSGVVLVEYSLDNNNWIDAAGTGAWTVPLTSLEDGFGQTFAVRSTDRAGNVSLVTEVDFDVDLASPELTETSSGILNSSTVYRNDDVILGGEASDGNILSSVIVTYKKDGDDAVPLVNDTNDDGIWSAILFAPLDHSADGTYEINITAKDVVGKTSVLVKNIIIDTLGPSVKFTGVFPVVGSETVNDVISWSGTSSDETAIDTVQYLLPGGYLTDVDNKTNWTVSGIDTRTDDYMQGTNNILTIVATDNAGNATTAEYTIYVDQDSDRPSFSYINVDGNIDSESGASGNLLETGAKIQGSISDDDGVDKNAIEVQIFNRDDSVYSSWSPISNPPSVDGRSVNWTHYLSSLSDGVYYARFRTSDINGVTETTEKLYFTIDLNPASLTISSPLSGTYHTSGVVINGSASDDNGLLTYNNGTDNLDYIEICNKNDNNWIKIDVIAGVWSYPVSAPSDHSEDGIKSYLIRSTDLFGKSSTLPLEFTIDTTPPGLTVDSPESGYWTNGYFLSVNGKSSDTNGVRMVEVSLDNAIWTTVNGTVSWNALVDISGLQDQENKTIYFRNLDNAGNITTHSAIINIDRTAPVLSETEIIIEGIPSEIGTGGISYQTEDYSLNGILSDNLISSLPTFDHDNDSSDEVSYIELKENSMEPLKIPVFAGKWSFQKAFENGIYNYEISITDKSGNESNVEYISIIADNIAPALETISSPSGVEQYISGSAYTISGAASDSGSSGLDSVYWWTGDVYNEAPEISPPYTDWTEAGGLGSWTGSIDLEAVGEGDKTLHVFSIDKAGNKSTTITVDFTVDQAAPLLSESGLAGTNIITNSNIILEVSVVESNGIVIGDHDDNVANDDVEFFEIMVNSSDWASDARKIEYTGNKMDLTVTTGELNQGNNEILLRVIDLAGRSSSVVKRGVFLDTVSPEVSFINIDSTSVVNGENIRVQGLTDDLSSTINSVTIAFKGPDDETFSSEQDVSGSYSWNYDLDLTPSGVYYIDGLISLRVTANDSAGNITIETVDFNIKQENDMPLLELSGIIPHNQGEKITISHSNSILSGVVYDDDGVDMNSLLISVNSEVMTPVIINRTDNSDSITWFVDLADISTSISTTFPYSVSALDSGGFSVKGNYSGIIGTNIVVLGSGSKISGFAKDDDSFDSSSFEHYLNGSISSGTFISGSDSTYVPWSHTLPESDNLYFFELNGNDTSKTAIPVDWEKYGGETLKALVVKDSGDPVVVIGSPSQGAYLEGSVVTSGEAFDDLAISILKITAVQSDNVASLELTNNSSVALDETEGDGEYYYDTSSGKWIWDFALERLPDAYENDSITLVYEAQDIVGNKTIEERSITIDTIDPVVVINSPADGDIVNGNVTFQGVVSDIKLDTVEMKLGSNEYETISGGYNWSMDVSSATLVNYAEDLGNGTYRLPVIVRATDAAGNIGLSDSYSILIDPDTDKPIVNVSSPSNNSTLGGAILVIGSATDDDAVGNVELRIDFNGDGDFNDILDLNNDNDTTDNFETESSWVDVSYFKNGVWRHEINLLGELYKTNIDTTGDDLTGNETIDNPATGDINIQIHAWDINLTESLVTSFNLTLDETFPEIISFGVTGSPDTISGDFDLEWEIEDNEEIRNVAISYDGGLTYTDTIYDGSGNISLLEGGKTVDSDIDLGLAGHSSTVNLRMKAVDNTGYVSFSNLTLNIDNVFPTGTYTGRIEEIGDGEVWLSGTAVDTGAVRGIGKVEIYIIQDGKVLNPKDSDSNLPEAIEPETEDFGDGNGLVSYIKDSAYKIVIDNDQATELPDSDGYEEYMGVSGNTVEWQGKFDSSHINNDNPLQVHFVIWDNGGNRTHYVETMMMVGTDLNDDKKVDQDEMVAYPQGFKATNRLKVEMASGSNDNLYLYIEHDSSPVIDMEDDDGPMAFTINIEDYPDGKTTFDIQVRDSSSDPHVTVIQKILNVEIIGVDTTPPVVILNELNLGSIVDGHLETNSSYNGADHDVSGSITFTASASDNNRIQSINMIVETEDNTEISTTKIASWNNGLFEVIEGVVLTRNELSWENGHQVAWTIDWDSASITGTVGENIEVRFVATDFQSLNGEGSGSFDVVPFISSIDRGTSFNTYRSKYGYYTLRRGYDNGSSNVDGDTVRIYGYNLFDSTSDTIAFGSASVVNLSNPGENNYLSAVVPFDATSGPLSLTVNGIEAINNRNSNNESYHSEADAFISGSEEWTDDRYIHIWQSNNKDTGSNQGYFSGSNDPIYPAMTIDEGEGILYGSWSNYALSDVIYGSNNDSGEETIFSSYDPLEHTDIDFGSRATVVYNANIYGNNYWDQDGAGGVQVWDEEASQNQDSSYSSVGTFYNSEELWHDQMLMQFVNQRVVNDGDNIHISYYDTKTKALKYHYIQSGDSSYGELQTWVNIDGGLDSDDTINTINCNNYDDNNRYRPEVATVHVSVNDFVLKGQLLISLRNDYLDQDDSIYATSDGIISRLYVDKNTRNVDSEPMVDIILDRIVEKGNSSRSAAVGEFSAIDVMSNGNPVIAYYDTTSQTVKLAVASANNPTATQWTLQTVMDVADTNYQFSGKYISMKIDSNNDIHMVFYRNSTGNLVYMKSVEDPINDSGYTFGSSVVVDEIGSVGTWADITIDESDNPVISYLDSSKADTFDGLKMAFISTDKSDWEYMNVPLGFEVGSSRTSVENDIRTSGDDWDWKTAIGYSSSDFYRIAYYIPEE